MVQAVVDQPFSVVFGRVRQVAVSQGWLLSSGGQPQAPAEPMVFRRGFGSMRPSAGLVVQLATIDEHRTQVVVTVWRGPVVVDGYDADRFVQAVVARPL